MSAPDAPRPLDLNRRLERLELENRRLKRIGAGAFFLCGALSLTSMAGPRLCRTLKAERVVVEDSSGRSRMVLDAYSTEDPTITLKSKDGKPLARIGVEDGELSLDVFRSGAPEPARFRLEPEGSKDASGCKDTADEKGGEVD